MTELQVEDIVLKFRRPVTVDQNGCWNWLGSISSQGYGLFNGKVVYGIVFRMVGKTCALDRVICHRCDNKKCINPNHLYEGTYTENMLDSLRAGRGIGPEVYRKMVELKAQGFIQADIARKLGVSRGTVSLFFKGRFTVHKPENFTCDQPKKEA